MSAFTTNDVASYKGLSTLHLHDCASLQVLSERTDLEVLHIQHFPKVTCLDPLRQLSNLRWLSLSTTPGWDGKNRHLTVDTFEPLIALKKLEALSILGVIPSHGRLEPLSRMPNLMRISIGNTNFYQLEDFASLSSTLEKARPYLRPIFQMNFISMCKRCGAFPLLYLEGAEPRCPRYICPLCGRKKILAHLDRWNRAGGIPHYRLSSNVEPSELLHLFGNPTTT